MHRSIQTHELAHHSTIRKSAHHLHAQLNHWTGIGFWCCKLARGHCQRRQCRRGDHRWRAGAPCARPGADEICSCRSRPVNDTGDTGIARPSAPRRPQTPRGNEMGATAFRPLRTCLEWVVTQSNQSDRLHQANNTATPNTLAPWICICERAHLAPAHRHRYRYC